MFAAPTDTAALDAAAEHTLKRLQTARLTRIEFFPDQEDEAALVELVFSDGRRFRLPFLIGDSRSQVAELMHVFAYEIAFGVPEVARIEIRHGEGLGCR